MRRAVEICGAEKLAFCLGVTPGKLRGRMQGFVPPPSDVFLKVAEILGDQAVEELRQRPFGRDPAEADRKDA